MPNGNHEISGGVVGRLSGGRRLREERLSGRTLNRREKPLGRLSGGRPMKDENGDMEPDEDREAVEISRGSRNREISGGKVGNLLGGC